MTWKSPARWAGIALVLAAAILYLATLDNGLRPGELAGGDLITHQYAQVLGRPSNAPGYPLYTMGGWLWFHGWRSLLGQSANPTAILSAYSTLWALLALWLLYTVVLDLTGNWAISLLAAAFYAVTYFFWYYAVTTEQYTSAVAQTLAIVLLAFRWDAREGVSGVTDHVSRFTDHVSRFTPHVSRFTFHVSRFTPHVSRFTPHVSRSDRYLLALAFLCGLSLAHLITVAFIVPPLLWFILSRQPALLRRGKLVAQALLLAALPLLAYAFVYVRGAQHPEWRGAGEWSSTWAWFVDFLSTRQGRSELTWSLRPFLTDGFPSLIWRELGGIVLLGGIAGLFTLNRRKGIFLGSTLLIYLLFSFVDRQGNWFQVIMPAYALLVITFAALVQWIWERIEQGASDAVGGTRLKARLLDEREPAGASPPPGRGVEASAGGTHLRARLQGTRLRSALLALVIFVLAGLVAVRFVQTLPEANQRNRADDTALQAGQAILADQPAPNAAVLGLLDEALSLRYLTDIWEQRPDVRPVSSDEARALLASGQRPLYVTTAAAPLVWQEVDPTAHLDSAGQILIAVNAQPDASLPPAAKAVDQLAGDGLALAGYELNPSPGPSPRRGGAGGGVLRLFWRADAPIAHDWSISVRPTSQGQLIAGPGGSPLLVDRANPVHGAYPTTRWQPGEIVADDYFIRPLPGQSFDGFQVVVYRPDGQGGFENLAVLQLALR